MKDITIRLSGTKGKVFIEVEKFTHYLSSAINWRKVPKIALFKRHFFCGKGQGWFFFMSQSHINILSCVWAGKGIIIQSWFISRNWKIVICTLLLLQENNSVHFSIFHGISIDNFVHDIIVISWFFPATLDFVHFHIFLTKV